MADTFKLRVLKALTAALEEITTAGGFQHDLAGKVYRGRLVLTEADGLPALAVNEPPQSPDEIQAPEGSALQVTRHPLLIQGFVKDNRDHPTDPAYNLLGDVQKRLAAERTRARGNDVLGFGGKVSLEIGQAVVRPPDSIVSDNSFFWLPVTLRYVEDFQNPFA